VQGSKLTVGAEPFQGRGISLWREIVAEAKKLKLNSCSTNFSRDPEYISSRARIARLYATVSVWHGTGRYRYSINGEILDVLYGIVQQGGLIPQNDEWDVKFGNMHVLCTALSRMYARLYAGLYCPNGVRISNELGTRELWAYYFFVTSCLVAIFEYRLGVRAVLNRDLNALIPDVLEKTKRWVSKISSVPVSQKEAFLNGTDIACNYPILIGLKEGAFTPVTTSRYISLHERRAPTLIALRDISHIEVPLNRIQETSTFLRGLAIDSICTIPIEFGEEYSRCFSFWKLVSGRRLV
jgi:hypothetical protein